MPSIIIVVIIFWKQKAPKVYKVDLIKKNLETGEDIDLQDLISDNDDSEMLYGS